jgi:nucleotide-binding universal stress UspA family protein
LFATDFSSTAKLALPYVAEIARRYGSTVHAVHVIQPDVYPMVTPYEWQKIIQEEKEARKESIRELDDELRGLSHDLVFQKGDVWKNLAETIEAKHIDLLVLGTHGRTGIEKVLAGSVAEEVFRKASCPVLTVGPAVISKTTRGTAAKLDRILYATDFSPESLAAARYAISLAKENRAELTLMHSNQDAEPGHINSEFKTLQDVIPFGTHLEPKPRCTVERGTPVDAILDVAARDNPSLIVLGVRNTDGRVALATRFVRSIAYQVVVHASCPVLTIRT